MNLELYPARDPMVHTRTGEVAIPRWTDWLTALVTRLNRSPDRRQIVKLTNQSASIAVTAIELPTLSAGLYRVTWYARVTQAATTSSELTPAIRWTDGGVTITDSGTLMNGNTTATYQTRSLLVRIDNATTLRYLTTYASVGATPMKHSLYIVVEEIPLVEAV